MTPSSVRTLTWADQYRETEPEAAQEAYLAGDVDEVLGDPGRMDWLLERLTGELGESAVGLLEACVARSTVELQRRRALCSLASWHWYRGQREEALGRWRRARELGRELRDELWVGCSLNLALAFHSLGRGIESLALTTAAKQAAIALGSAYSVAYASVRRGNFFTRAGAFEAAELEFEDAQEAHAAIEDAARREVIESTLALGRARLHRERGELEFALRHQLRHLELVRRLPPAQLPVMVGALCTTLRLRYELEPENREALYEELLEVPRRYPLEETYDEAWRNELLKLELRRAELQCDRERLVQVALETLTFVKDFSAEDEHVRRFAELGKLLEEVERPVESQRAYGLAAEASLRRILELDHRALEATELSELRPEELRVLVEARARRLEEHKALFEAIAGQWRAGHPAARLVLDDGDTIKACAWCHLIHTVGDRWVPLAEFLPPESEASVSHGICPRCAGEVGAEPHRTGAGGWA